MRARASSASSRGTCTLTSPRPSTVIPMNQPGGFVAQQYGDARRLQLAPDHLRPQRAHGGVDGDEV